MNPLSLISRGLLGDGRGEINIYYEFPFNITIDYGAKQIDVLVEDETLDIVVEQEVLNVEAGQENIDITLDQPDVTIED
jgi:hypothetical protein